jgi:hypothetical protein
MPKIERRAARAIVVICALLVVGVLASIVRSAHAQEPVCSMDWSQVAKDTESQPDIVVRYVLQPSLVKTIEDNFNKMEPVSDFDEPVLAFVVDKRNDEAYLFFLNQAQTCAEHFTGPIPEFHTEIQRLMTPNAPPHPNDKTRRGL